MTQSIIHRLFNALIGATLFAILSSIGLSYYFNFFDKTQYYEITDVKVIVPVVKRGDNSSFVITRNALVDLQARAVSELILVNADEPQEEVTRKVDDLSIERGLYTAIVKFPIPCEVNGGTYFWKGTVKYDIRGVSHIATWRSPNFEVSKEALTICKD